MDQQLIIGTLALCDWDVTFVTAKRDQNGRHHLQFTPRCTTCEDPHQEQVHQLHVTHTTQINAAIKEISIGKYIRNKYC